MKRLLGRSCLNNNIYSNDNSNNHILITGVSGSGKTYEIYNIISQDIKKGIPVVIIDTASSFKLSEMPKEFKTLTSGFITEYNASREVLPINPFALKEYIDEGVYYTETSNEVANRMSSIFKRNLKLGCRQYPTVLGTIMCMLNEKVSLTMDSLIERLYITDKYAAQVAEKLYPITTSVKFSNTTKDIWCDITDRSAPKITIFQLSSLGKDAARLCADIILDDFFKHLMLVGECDTPVTLVLDELQNLDLDNEAILSKMLKESRKYGLSMVCCTQHLTFKSSSSNTIIRDLEQAGTKLYFRPAEIDIFKLIKLLAVNSNLYWGEVVKKLQRGRCIVETGDKNFNDLDKLVYVYPIDKLYKELGYVPTMLLEDINK